MTPRKIDIGGMTVICALTDFLIQKRAFAFFCHNRQKKVPHGTSGAPHISGEEQEGGKDELSYTSSKYHVKELKNM